MKLKIYIPVLFTAALSVLSGCYTVVEHPDVQGKDENGYTYNSKVYFYDDCQSCHQDNEHQGQMTQNGEHLSMFKAHDDTVYDNGYYPEEGYYSDQYYYPTQYYGDYGNYYNTPWWSTVTPPEDVTKQRNNGNSQAIQYNGRSRNESGDRGRDPRQSTDSSPTRGSAPNHVSTSGGGGGSSSSGSSATTTSTQQPKTETRSSSENNSSRNSNDQPRSRNNDSNRSSNSGRR